MIFFNKKQASAIIFRKTQKERVKKFKLETNVILQLKNF